MVACVAHTQRHDATLTSGWRGEGTTTRGDDSRGGRRGRARHPPTRHPLPPVPVRDLIAPPPAGALESLTFRRSGCVPPKRASRGRCGSRGGVGGDPREGGVPL